MKNKPVVSIVLPTYNGAKYIRESLDSILAQTFQDWELIIVNDCSADETPQIAAEYAKKDERVRIIHNGVNQRLPESLNIGFRTALGKYLTWTSDDNRYLPTALARMVEELDNNNDCPMVCADMYYIDAKGNITGKAPGYDEYYMLSKDLIGACFLYRRKVLDIVGEYDSSRVYVEDYDYWLRIYKHVGKIIRIPHILYEYRAHNGSLTATKMSEIRKQAVLLWSEYRKEFLNQYCNDKKVLCEIYYYFVMANGRDKELARDIEKLVPELAYENNGLLKDKKIFIFGSGDFGSRAVEMVKNNVIGFIDNDKNKIGTEKAGMPIISFEEYCSKYKKQADILVAVSGRYIYEIIHQILEAGIGEYYTYQQLQLSNFVAGENLL